MRGSEEDGLGRLRRRCAKLRAVLAAVCDRMTAAEAEASLLRAEHAEVRAVLEAATGGSLEAGETLTEGVRLLALDADVEHERALRGEGYAIELLDALLVYGEGQGQEWFDRWGEAGDRRAEVEAMRAWQLAAKPKA